MRNTTEIINIDFHPYVLKDPRTKEHRRETVNMDRFEAR